MKSDAAIAQETTMLPINEIASRLGINFEMLESYGKYKAKLPLNLLQNRKSGEKKGKLILVTAINPTPAGEGKTTTSIGLTMALNRIGKKSIAAIREPSLGPVFGIKGGAAGGGYAQVVPMEDINLHFTGDFHAITSANNLLSALLDNHLQQGNQLNIHPKQIFWHRVMDMNDRSLRHLMIGMGSKGDGFTREEGFDITAASEIMAILCLAEDLEDLKLRLDRIILAYDREGNAVRAKDLHATGALTLLLKDAMKPNLVQTLEHTPVLIHGGPFANIAHGCNSVIATKMALGLSDYVVTEAGFGADLGAEKFFDIKCRSSQLQPHAVVLVATVRALKMNGGLPKNKLEEKDQQALARGLKNLERHLENLHLFRVPSMVAINYFPGDREEEIDMIQDRCKKAGTNAVVSKVFSQGGKGGEKMAEELVKLCQNKKSDFSLLYEDSESIEEKITGIAQKIYRAKGVDFSDSARKQLEKIKELKLEHLPVCIAKTQYSFSDNPHLLGAPEGFHITVRELKVSAGAGFIVVLTGSIMTMPGLPKTPAAEMMEIDQEGKIKGLF